MKLLSIVVPVYNLEACIERCIRSLYRQNLDTENYEVIFINDGSTDRTTDIIKMNWQENMLLLEQENARQGAARNNGVRNATGKYIWFVDGDDAIEDNCLKKLTDTLEKYSPDILFTGRKIFTDSGTYTTTRGCLVEEETSRIYSGSDYLSKRNLTLGPCFFFRKQFLLKNNLFFMEKTFYEDSEFMPRACFLAERIMHLNYTPYLIYEREGSSMRSINPNLMFDALSVSAQLLHFALKRKEEKGSEHLFYYAVMAFNVAMSKSQDATLSQKSKFWKQVSLLELIEAMIRSKHLKYLCEIPYVLFKTHMRCLNT